MTDVEVITPIDAVNIHRVKYGEIKEIFNKLHYDDFKDIFKENRIIGYCKGYVYVIDQFLKRYDKLYDLLNRIKYKVLLNICIKNKLLTDDGHGNGLSKDMFIYIIISAVYIKNKIIKHPVILEPILSEDSKKIILECIENAEKAKKEEVSSETIEKPNTIISEIDQAKQKLNELLVEKKKQEDLIKKQEKLLEKKKKQEEEAEKKRLSDEEKEKKRIEEETKKQLIETLKAEKAAARAEKRKLEEELEKQKKITEESILPPQYEETQTTATSAPTATNQRRRPLPACVRDSVWNHYIGEDINKHRCLCCKQVKINNREFQVGHVISVRDGGTDEINNLRPICAPCNHSMGTKNMIEFVKTYGYYIG